MKILKIIGIVLLSIVLLISFSISIMYFNQSAREKAEFWYLMINFDRQGSVGQQWCLEKSIEADSTFCKGYMQKSVAFNKRGSYSEGFRLLNKAVEISPLQNLGYRTSI